MSLRNRLGDHLLQWGATLALETRQMRRSMHRATAGRYADNLHVQAILGTQDVLSGAAIRLGMLVSRARATDALVPDAACQETRPGTRGPA